MGFETHRAGDLEYLTAPLLAGTPHCFSTRFGGVSEGVLASLNLGVHRGDKPKNVLENYRRLGEAVGFDAKRTVFTKQIHSDIVERVAKAVGAVHAGWRGTAAAIAAKAVERMTVEFGSKPENIRAAIGPCISQCCFETDRDVPDAMLNAFGDAAREAIREVGAKYYVNLKALNALALTRAGVQQIDIAAECTACAPDRFWSHRRVGNHRGSLAAMILLRGDTQ